MKFAKTTLQALTFWCASVMVAPLVSATTIEFEWTGSSDYSLSGSFSFDSSLTGIIEETDLDSFYMEGSWFGFPLGSWDMTSGVSAGSSAFNFNYDSSSMMFVYGGTYDTDPFHISWGDTTSGLAFVGGDVANGIILDGFDDTSVPGFPFDWDFEFSGVSVNDASQFSVTEVPVPATLALFGLGLAGLGLSRRQARRA